MTMAYPEVLLLPLMMFADYLLTVLGAVEREKKYSQHFRVQHYELNPLWQKDIAAKRWFNPRHTALVIFASAALLLAVEFVPLPRHFVQGALGCILTAYGYIVAKHVTNLLGFRHVIQKPDEVSGEVTMAHPYALAVSLYQCLAMTLPIALIAVFSASWFAYGGAIGMLLLAAAHYRWLRKARRKQAPPSPARGCSDRGQGKENEPVKGTLAIQEQSSAGGCLGELGWLGAGFVLPCASLTFYRRAARRRVVAAVAFFVLFSLLISGLQTLSVGRALLSVRAGIRDVFETGEFPEIVIRDGVARVNAEQPLVLQDQGGSIFVIDTTGTYRRLDRSTHSQGFLLTRTSLQVMNADGRYQELPLEALHEVFGANPIVVNADSASRFWVGFTAIATPVAFLGLAIWHVLIRFIYLATLGLVIWGVVSLLRPNTGFGPVLITGLYAVVPAMYAHYLLGRLGIRFITLQTLLLVPLWGIALAVALVAPGRSMLGRERPLRGWRALFGVPLLLVFALDVVFAPRWGAAIAWSVAWLTLVFLAGVGLWSAWRETRPAALADA